jgi:DNA replication protein
MNNDKLINIIKMGNIVIPLYLLRNYQKLNISLNALIVLSYLLNKDNVFDCKQIGEDLNIDEKLVLEYINELQVNDLVSINVKKNSRGITEEKLSFEHLYNKVSLLLLDNSSSKENNIYEIFEHELGRTLSPMEYEIIGGWLDAKYGEELIVSALKEAVYNGANNLRYIDKILYEWHKKGFKKANDVDRDREKHNKAKNEPIEVPDYNWLEDNEEDK